jgi:hypothetical protein
VTPRRGSALLPGAWILPLWAFALGALAAATRIRAYDFFWHLETGRWIARHGTVPRADPFSFTAAGASWVDHSWGYQLLAYALSRPLGLAGPWMLKVAIGGVVGLVLARALRVRNVSSFTAVVCVAVAVRGAAFRFTDRPEILSLACTALLASLICSADRPSRRRVLGVLLLTAAWANLHGGAVLAPILVAAAAAGEACAAAIGRDAPRGRGAAAWLGVAGLSALALLCNPYGARLLEVPWTLSRLLREPWAQNPEWVRPAFGEFPLVYAAVVGLMVLSVLRPRGIGAGAAMALLGGALALSSVRHVGLCFVLLPFAVPGWAGRPGPAGRAETLFRRATVLLAAAAIAWMGVFPVDGTLGPGTEPGRFPEDAADFLERERIVVPMFNEVAFGGYLLHRFPDRPLFIDGRNEIYPEVLRRIYAGQSDLPLFWRAIDDWKLDAALLRYPAGPQQVAYTSPDGRRRLEPRSWSEIYFPSKSWALVYWDDVAMLRVRRSAFPADWTAAREWSVNPDDWPRVRQEIAAGRLTIERVRAELQRRLAQPPDSARARLLLSELKDLAPPGAPASGEPRSRGAE